MRLSSSVASKLRISRCGFTITRSPAACALRTSAPRSRKPKWRSGFAKTGSSRPRCSGSQVWIETQVTPREARRRKDASPASERPSLIHHDTPRRKPGASTAPSEGASAGASGRDRLSGAPLDLGGGPGGRGSHLGGGRDAGGLPERAEGRFSPGRGQGLGRLEGRAGVAVGERLGQHRLRLGPPRLGQRAEQPRAERGVVPRPALEQKAGGGDEVRVVAVRLVARDLPAVGKLHDGAPAPPLRGPGRRLVERGGARWRASLPSPGAGVRRASRTRSPASAAGPPRLTVDARKGTCEG